METLYQQTKDIFCDYINFDIPKIKALITHRYIETNGYRNNFNLSSHSGDTHVGIKNRIQLKGYLKQEKLQWLKQIHGNNVVIYNHILAGKENNADACVTSYKNMPCSVLSADCLPLLIASCDGRKVAAVHAGWRGLLAGIIENTLRQFDDDIKVWAGPCISQKKFEVGQEVFDQFVYKNKSHAIFFKVKSNIIGKYFLDLRGLAKDILLQNNVSEILEDSQCTFNNPDRFFSYRRDGSSGCMASTIWME